MNTDLRIFAGIVLACAISGFVFAGEAITLVSPVAGGTSEKTIVVEGGVGDANIERVTITVEPFLAANDGDAVSVTVRVRDGRFRREVALFPRLNVIRVVDAGSGEREAGLAVYCAADEVGDKAVPHDAWGRSSPVVFSAPRGLKVTTARVGVEGVVTDEEVKMLDIVVLDTMAFAGGARTPSTPGSWRYGAIEYRRVEVRKLKFATEVTLKQGLNMILAKPVGTPGSAEDVQVKSVLYEPASDGISLDELKVEAGNLIVRGRVSGIKVSEVRVTVECLVEEKLRPGRIHPRTVIDARAPVDSDGVFRLEAPLLSERYAIKTPPSVIVSASGEIATRTLVKWR